MLGWIKKNARVAYKKSTRDLSARAFQALNFVHTVRAFEGRESAPRTSSERPGESLERRHILETLVDLLNLLIFSRIWLENIDVN